MPVCRAYSSGPTVLYTLARLRDVVVDPVATGGHHGASVSSLQDQLLPEAQHEADGQCLRTQAVSNKYSYICATAAVVSGHYLELEESSIFLYKIPLSHTRIAEPHGMYQS